MGPLPAGLKRPDAASSSRNGTVLTKRCAASTNPYPKQPGLMDRPRLSVTSSASFIILLYLSIVSAAPSKEHSAAPSSNKTVKVARRKGVAEQQVQAQARKLVRAVSQLRGLPAKGQIKIDIVTRKEVVAQLEQRLGEDYSLDEIRAEGTVLKRLGLLPLQANYRSAVLKLLTEQVAGFYDPKRKRLNIAAWVPLDLQVPTLVHEICHALQDHRYNLLRFTRPIKDNSDRQLARSATVEGDCTAVMLEYVLASAGTSLSSASLGVTKLVKQMSAPNEPQLSSAPPFLTRTLSFPYVYGLRLVQTLRATRPWSSVNRLLRKPPTTTEQVMHFDKFRRRERQLKIAARPLAALDTYRMVKQDTVGEFQLGLFLSGGKRGTGATARAAAGWNGDRLVAYAPQGAKDDALPLLVHVTAWDSEADAIEYGNELQYRFGQLAGEGVAPSKPTRSAASDRPHTWIFADADQLLWTIQRYRRYVLALAAVPADIQPELQREVWSQWRCNGRPLRP